ncbi:3-oxoacyl-[acyl-carrier-protein] reductase FabG [Pleomorphomonas sp. SM30]|uniref:NAD(P)-dependent dehydrogenase (Short-subunit alcohol dehydrogenase family) n=2 Tax=Oharaeibacter diazotrophicus TaxID=1920512 RepID=A0A4R6R8X5_9HYPH|nr:SDR family oxidoreductase [Oharaeibacter diazotrophicus]TDP82493.1 NAD(P)-dependent dehydrogenase (short-subunit alcohol dehydrogenase family) [Oharaeibacter diazotrophicus]BBE72743.1 3-oxoacyl-[acyl-carrier-protein] reductase FabG [Pleomorphomonas sp. SM30]GLS76779.1 short chain dehydrogenase [Oharaeibacter diazotrophicus]
MSALPPTTGDPAMYVHERGVAVVTGAARRIGRAIALDLAAHGHAVAVHCNASREEAEEVAEEIRHGQGRAMVVTADLADPAAVARVMAEVEAGLGVPTVLVNNASLFERDEVLTLDPDLYARHMAVNLTAPVFLARDLARRLPADREGLVINMIDQRVWRLTPMFFSYTLAKSALWTATQTLAQGLAPKVRVAGIGPGPTLANTRQSPADFRRQTEAVPLRRGPGLAEVTAAIRFVLETPSFTGQMLALDGGQHLAWETPDVVGVGE